MVDKAKSAVRGTWWLCQALNLNSTGNEVSENAGFTVFKDRAVVVFYCKFAVKCVHSLAQLQRWIGYEILHRTTLNVPTVVVGYNLFVIGVDRFDQVRSTTPMKRKEQRVSMYMFCFAIDSAIQNSFFIFGR